MRLRSIVARIDMRANPLFVRLTQKARWPTVPMTLCLALGLAVITLAMGLRLPHYVPPPNYVDSIGIMSFTGWFVLFSVPASTSIVAFIVIQRDVRDRSYAMLRLTGLPERAIVRGYVAAALYRARVPLAIAAGTIPLFVIGWSNLPVALTHSLGVPLASAHQSTIGRVLELLGVAVGLWGLNFTIIAGGVWGTLYLRREITASGKRTPLTGWWKRALLSRLMALPMLVVMELSTILLGLIVWPAYLKPTWLRWPSMSLLIILAWGNALFTYLFGFWEMHLAERWA